MRRLSIQEARVEGSTQRASFLGGRCATRAQFFCGMVWFAGLGSRRTPRATYATGTGNDGRKQLQGFSHTHVVTGIERQIVVEKKLVFASAVDETDEEARVAYAVTE